MERIGLPLPWGIVPAERLFRTVNVPNPAAGAGVNVPVPGGQVWVLIAARLRLVTSAVVANRFVRVAVTDGTDAVFENTIERAVTASLTTIVSLVPFGAVQGTLQAQTMQVMSVPAGPWLAGEQFQISVDAIDVGDQISQVRFYVAEYDVRGLESALERYLAAEARAGVGG